MPFDSAAAWCGTQSAGDSKYIFHDMWKVWNYSCHKNLNLTLWKRYKIKIKIARAHHFLNLQRTGNKKIFMWPNALMRYVPTYKMKKRYEDR